MNPISRFRTRARSHPRSSATGRPFSSYEPLVGESSRPRMESSVDLPQPDGPPMETYSPRAISTSTCASACVSTSSVAKTLVIPCNLMTGGMDVMLRFLLEADAIERIPRGHIRQHHLIADVESRQ